MTVQELINKASDKCPEFKRKIDHRINKRQKAPEFSWLIQELTRVLGEDTLKQAAQEEIERLKAAAIEAKAILAASAPVTPVDLAGPGNDTNYPSHNDHIEANIKASNEIKYRESIVDEAVQAAKELGLLDDNK